MNDKPNQYNHKEIEKKWQENWAQKEVYKTKEGEKNNEYILVEFPYPSGNLHVGHWYAFAVTDIYAKYRRMTGKNVLFPVGFDAFGLPAENAAIKNNLNPREWTYSNIDFMKGQLNRMGASFDWERLVITCSPEYYKWTQWLFLKFLENDLAYQSETNVNWCPSCKTVLANEQVTGGHCERCDSEVIQKKMKQWQFKITKYADRLIDDLDTLDWPHAIKEAQRNWIGRSSGSLLPFKIADSDISFKVFTTRADTLFGVTYVVLAPESEIVKGLLEKVSNREAVEKYIAETSKKTEMDRIADVKEKTGVILEGIFAINPTNNEKVPVYIADYVLAGYGTGAVMAVPAHDERDFEFAKKFNLEIRQVILPVFKDYTPTCKPDEKITPINRRSVICIVKHWNEDKYLMLQWKKANWRTPITGGMEEEENPAETGLREIQEETGYKNVKVVRQSEFNVVGYYYNPIKSVTRFEEQTPVLYQLENDEQTEISEEEKEKHDLVWIEKSEVKKFLDFDQPNYDSRVSVFAWEQSMNPTAFPDEGVLTNSDKFNGLSSADAQEKITNFVGGEMTNNYRLRDWLISRQRYWGCPIPVIHCAKCGPVAVPEADLPVVLPEISDFLPREDGKSPLAKATDWLNVKCPKCGGDAERETDTLDTFIDSSWYYLRYLDPKNENNFSSLEKQKNWMPVEFYSGGSEHTTMHLLFARFFHKVLFDLKLVETPEPFKNRLNRGLILGPDGNKMSKSKGNVVDPDEIVERLGADTVRGYLSFIGPYNESGSYPWDPNGVVGIRRFIEKVCRIEISTETSPEVKKELAKTIKKVSEDYQKLKFNTALAQLMIFTNLVSKNGIAKSDYEIFLKLIFPIFPHVAEELWSNLGNTDMLVESSWPENIEIDEKTDIQKLTIHINGKMRGVIETDFEADEAKVKETVLANPEISKWLTDKTIKKTIFIKGKLFSIVTD
jgi:leucyl-tRNA synthetase